MSMDIVRHRLYNQKLLHTSFTQPGQVVAWFGAVQAQDYAGAKWAVAQRAKGLTDAALEQALADGTILRTHILRPTWHFVAPADIRWMLALTAPRVHAASAYYYRQLELNKAIIKKSYSVLEKTLRGGKQLTRTEIASAFKKAGMIAEGQKLGYFMMSAELDGVICSAARKGKQFTYALLEERVPQVKGLKRDEALAEIVRRYFMSRGPANLQDFTWWSGLTMADARNGIEMVKSEFMQEDINGKTYWLPNSTPSDMKTAPIAHLLPNYDEYFIGFKDRSAIGNRVNWSNFDENTIALNTHIIFIDGQIVGGWKRTLGKNEVAVELNPLTNLTKAENRAIAIAVQQYGEFIGMPVTLTKKDK